MTTEETPAISVEVRDLVKRFGAFTTVDRVSFSASRGEIMGFLEPTAPANPPS